MDRSMYLCFLFGMVNIGKQKNMAKRKKFVEKMEEAKEMMEMVVKLACKLRKSKI